MSHLRVGGGACTALSPQTKTDPPQTARHLVWRSKLLDVVLFAPGSIAEPADQVEVMNSSELLSRLIGLAGGRLNLHIVQAPRKRSDEKIGVSGGCSAGVL
ncbi:MAG: hypothetical protein Q8M31_11255 [Beijerinckiaceae bacterium]|nr:hypothetical protein [Beijerinckiaceae bacterium]